MKIDPNLRPLVLAALTKREQEVAQLLLCALTNQEIATALNISIKTVKRHFQHIAWKAGLSRVNRVKLAMTLIS